MDELSNALYDSQSLRACEQQAMDVCGLDASELMLRAGKQAFLCFQKIYPEIKRIAIFCGAGNNAGDGYVFARLAHEQGLEVSLYQCRSVDKLPLPAKDAATKAIAAGVACQPFDISLTLTQEVIIDALLGIGIQGAVRGNIALAINQINSSGLPVVSLDLPSGLNADTGQVIGTCVKADTTLCLIALKVGMYTLDGPDYCGTIQYCSLQLESCLANIPIAAKRISPKIPKARAKNTHKSDYGHVLVIGGGPGMPGAVSLCAKAVLRAGAGLVTIATWPSEGKEPLSLLPEAMVWGVKRASELKPLLAAASLCVIGPGLGLSAWGRRLFLAAMDAKLPMVVDASALRLLAKYPTSNENWVLTPHPGEASNLLGSTTKAVQMNRLEAVRAIQKRYKGVVVLKGVGTLIQTDKECFLCDKGNPGMASAGMGDVLTGIIAGLIAQGLSLEEAAKLAVWAHAVAGDKVAALQGERGMLASDLLDTIPSILNGVVA
jgi:hydroxyethylthiazole kinase-like uncharacterized protein yjeF